MTNFASQPMHRTPSFASLARTTKLDVDAALAALADEQVKKATALSDDAGVIVGALFDLATRGGKRLRPALLAAAFVACGGDPGASAVLDAGVALELLQAYLLAHDDWMDDDDVRRGGQSVHAALRARFRDRASADACAILAGDWAAGLALEMLVRARVPPARMVAAVREFAVMHNEVVTGQMLDVRHVAKTRADVETVHRLKTSSYTARSPLALGGILAGADSTLCDALREAGEPMGIAFQLRDDLLGTFGEPHKTGKSVHGDLREGKRTALVVELEENRETAPLVARVLGVADAPIEDVDALLQSMVDSGAKARVEARCAELVALACGKIERLPLSTPSKQLLLDAAVALGAREG